MDRGGSIRRRYRTVHLPSKAIPKSHRRLGLAGASFVAAPSWACDGGTVSQEFDVVCLGGGVAGEAIAVGLQGSGLTLAVVERVLVGGECPYWGWGASKPLLRCGAT